ncbi:MAG TPA: cyclase family protein [Thermoanaerobaculia bacterium]|nr:cyclase family protein [Thermoanaerobaculia bacterium]
MKRWIDLSHTIRDGLITYPGLPAPVIGEFVSRAASRQRYAPGVEFHIGRIEMVANTGTYVDAPFHRYEDGPDLARLPLERLADLDAVVVDSRSDRAVTPGHFEGISLRGKGVLVRTGFDANWGSAAYFENNPFLTREAAEHLVAENAALVGIDSLNVDDPADASRPAHSILLAAGIPIVEHLARLGSLPAEGFRFFAVPVKVAGMGSFPVRAFAIVDDEG